MWHVLTFYMSIYHLHILFTEAVTMRTWVGHQNPCHKPAVVVGSCNPDTWETEIGRFLGSVATNRVAFVSPDKLRSFKFQWKKPCLNRTRWMAFELGRTCRVHMQMQAYMCTHERECSLCILDNGSFSHLPLTGIFLEFSGYLLSLLMLAFTEQKVLNFHEVHSFFLFTH